MKKSVIFIISGGVALFFIVAVGIGIAVSGSSDPQQLTEDFNEAVRENDAEALQDVVEVDDDMVWPDEQIQTTLEMLHDPEHLEETMQLLNIQASYYEDEAMAPTGEVTIHELLNMGAFYIDEEENVFGNSYTLRVRPYHVHLSADPGSEVTLLGENYAIDDDESVSIGAYGPGSYPIQGELDTAYVSNTEQEEMTLFDHENFEVEHSFDLSGEPITAQSTMPNTAVFIDGDEVDQIDEEDLGDADGWAQSEEGKEIGEVSPGHEIHGEADLPWGTATSDPMEIEEDTHTYTITPDPLSMDETAEALADVINDYVIDRMEALTEQDMDRLSSDAVSEEIESEIESTVQDYDDDRYLEGEVLGTRIDFGDVDYRYDDGGTHMLSIPVEREESTREHRAITSDDDFSEDFEQLIVDIVYDDDDDGWIVHDVENDHDASSASSDDPYMTGDRVVETDFE